jgi:hypothetical protein
MSTVESETETETVAVKPKAKRAPRAKSATPRTRKSAEPPRMKVVWAIYNQHLRRVATFNFDQVAEADKKLKELNKDGTTFFKQKVKEEVNAAPAETEA